MDFSSQEVNFPNSQNRWSLHLVTLTIHPVVSLSMASTSLLRAVLVNASTLLHCAATVRMFSAASTSGNEDVRKAICTSKMHFLSIFTISIYVVDRRKPRTHTEIPSWSKHR
ncbi:hypothetical protein Tco_0629629 [Tanacetum coccineum]|uniref:Uncharacterized protein n=1 Tax=Tanacetum coccineum TaxID=301880 RepID=A0ABQ4WTN6_9ASTR